jgi:phage shock protein PspC (stress-responsive transcriptional regulator)
MNEIKKIHLGRQAFTISIDAHKELRAYLDAIGQQVGPKGEEVIKEVELRMAELLAERGITGEKVVLPEDVAFLKEQLGEPSEFRDEDSEDSVDAAHEKDSQSGQKRLFRDTEHGMAAGVASGLAAYFGIDAVIVRLIFVVLTLVWGWGALLYLLLWLIVPEAKTSSERLQMRGLPVTVDSLKEIIDRADMPGVASRANKAVSGIVGSVGRVILIVIGTAFLIAAFALFLGTVVGGTYLLVHGSEAAGSIMFPIGSKEIIVTVSATIALTVIAALLAVVGVSLMRRKWSLPGWSLAILLALFFTAVAIGTALGLDAAPNVRKRYDTLEQTQTVTLSDFKSAELTGRATDFTYQKDDRYYVELHYFGTAQKLPVKAEVTNGVLALDTSEYSAKHTCNFLCLYSDERLRAVIHAPSLEAVTVKGSGSFANDGPLTQESMLLSIGRDIQLYLGETAAKTVDVTLNKSSDDFQLRLNGLGQAGPDSYLNLNAYGGIVHVDHFDELRLKTANGACEEYQPRIYARDVGSAPKIVVNNKRLQSSDELRHLRSPDARTAYNCLVLQ